MFDYRSGTSGVFLNPNDSLLARQNPADYVLGLQQSILSAVAMAAKVPDFSASKLIGIGVADLGQSRQ